MKILALFLLSLVGASHGLRCDYSKCKSSNPFEELREVRFMPTAQQLREYCPKMLSFLNCNIDVVERCVGKDINEIATSTDESIVEATSMLLGVGSLVREICNPHSVLHKDYVANIECFRGFITVGSKLCDYESQETLGDFLSKSNIEKGGLDDELNGEIRCLEVGYTVTCLSIRLGESCGERARNAFVNVVRQLKPLVDNGCGNGPSDLKNKFTQYMQVDDDQMIKMKETLDLFRRKR